MENFYIFGAKYLIYFIVFIALVVVIQLVERNRKKGLKEIAIVLISIIVMIIINKIIEHLLPSERPFIVQNFKPLIPHSANPSFPSDHASWAALLSSFIFEHQKKLGLLILILATFVGAARIFVGVHYVSDVLAGFIIGPSCFYLVKTYGPKVIRNLG